MPREIDLAQHIRNRLAAVRAKRRALEPEIRSLTKALRALESMGGPIVRRVRRKLGKRGGKRKPRESSGGPRGES